MHEGRTPRIAWQKSWPFPFGEYRTSTHRKPTYEIVLVCAYTRYIALIWIILHIVESVTYRFQKRLRGSIPTRASNPPFVVFCQVSSPAIYDHCRHVRADDLTTSKSRNGFVPSGQKQVLQFRRELISLLEFLLCFRFLPFLAKR